MNKETTRLSNLVNCRRLILVWFFFFLLMAEINGNTSMSFQTGNTISGYVFGAERQPVYDISVELLDDFSRSVARAKTNASGRYYFGGLHQGKFRIRVLPTGSDFEEQEQDVEIQNITRSTPNGGTIISGFENVQKDFYLRKRQRNSPKGRPETVFVQEIPASAKEKYEIGLKLIEEKQNLEGLKSIKTAIEIFPQYFEAIQKLGTEYIKLQYYEAAQILLTQAVEINPRAFQSWYGLGYASYSLNNVEAGVKAVNKALELNPNSVESLLLNGVIQRKLKRYEEALKQLKKAKSLAKDSIPEIHWQLALLYAYNLNRYANAADELELYLKAKPENIEAENIKKLIKQFREKAKLKN